MYIDPNDLSFAMGVVPRGLISKQILTLVEQVIAQAHKANKFVGSFTRDGAEGRRLLDMGADLVTPGNDVGLLNSAAVQRIAEMRATTNTT